MAVFSHGSSRLLGVLGSDCLGQSLFMANYGGLPYLLVPNRPGLSLLVPKLNGQSLLLVPKLNGQSLLLVPKLNGQDREQPEIRDRFIGDS